MILSGIRVLDFTQYLAGPTVTRLMAEMGAEIVKVELAPTGDPSRGLPFIKDRRSGYFIQQNRGKQSLCVDWTKPEGLALLKELAAKVDVVVENSGPGVMEKRGLDYATISKTNPRVVMASISAFGRVSPLAHKTGYDWIAQAYAGVMHMTGPKDGPPHPVGLGIADTNSGVHAFSAIGYALFHRERTGQGQYLDISMIDCLFHMHEGNVQGLSLGPDGWEPHRFGSHHELVCPVGVFKGPTGYMVIMALQPQWKNMCEAMQRPDLLDDPRFADSPSRAENQGELIPMIEAWLATFATNEAAIARLEACRVPCAPVLSPSQAEHEAYYRERGTLRTTHDPIAGDVKIPGFPLRFSAQPELPELVAPTLGQHNGRVLGGLLGYSAERIAGLEKAGVLAAGDR
jgi:crotonobetainyl-CoA:carnitine CoA-transferase CaiB-like acyl-CoA transferase